MIVFDGILLGRLNYKLLVSRVKTDE